jgi:hypothetical protein
MRRAWLVGGLVLLAVVAGAGLGSTQTEAEAHFKAGWNAKMAARYDLAITELTRCLEIKPDSINAAWVLGWVYAERGNKAEAAAQFRRILRWVPGTAKAFEACAAIERMGQSPYPPRADLSGVAPTAVAVRSVNLIDHAADPLWTADGNLVVYTRHGMGVCVADADGSQPRLAAPGLRLVGLSDDGKLAYGVTCAPMASAAGGAGVPPMPVGEKLTEVTLLSGFQRLLPADIPGEIEKLLPAPGGKALAIVSNATGSKETSTRVITLMLPDGSKATPLPAARLSAAPVWAGDGSKLLWSADGKVMVSGPDGSDAKAIMDGASAGWLSATQLLVRTPAGDLQVIGPDGANPAMLVETVKDLRITDAFASPSGKYVLYCEQGRSWSFIDVASKVICPLGTATDPAIGAQWLPKADLLIVGNHEPTLGAEPLWELIDPAKPADFHPLLRDAFVWGQLGISPDGRLAAYWRGAPTSVKFSPTGSFRQNFSGKLTLGATDNSARLPWTTISAAAEGSTVGMAWSPKSDGLVYWVPSTEQVGVVALRAKTDADGDSHWPLAVPRTEKTAAAN